IASSLHTSELDRRRAEARDQAERAEADRDERFLNELSDSLRVKVDSDKALYLAAQRLATHLDAARSAFLDIDVPAGRGIIRLDYHQPDLRSIAGPLRLASFSPENQAELGAGRTVLVEDTATDPRTASTYEASYRPLGVRST